MSNRPIILIHVPRTGGTSMETALVDYLGADNSYSLVTNYDMIRAKEQPTKRFYQFGHRGVEKLLQSGLFEQTVYDSAFKFCFVRNTWERLVSVYNYYRSFRDPKYYSTKYLESFGKWLASLQDRRLCFRKGLYLRVGPPWFCLAKPQTLWTNQKGVEFVGSYENLRDDWRRFTRLVGIPPIRLPHVNSSYKADYRSYYTTRQADYVSRLYQEEIEEYGFSF